MSEDNNPLLRRRALAQALRDAGFPVSEHTLRQRPHVVEGRLTDYLAARRSTIGKML
jgi:hypothetical protein